MSENKSVVETYNIIDQKDYHILVGLNKYNNHSKEEEVEIITPCSSGNFPQFIDLGLLDMIEKKMWTPILYAFENVNKKKTL